MTDNTPPIPVADALLQRLDAEMPLPAGKWSPSTAIESLDSLSTLRLLLTLSEELRADFADAIQAFNDRATIADLVAALSKSTA